MKTILYPAKKDWHNLLKRPSIEQESLFDSVRSILRDVKLSGDDAVRQYTSRFDGVDIKQTLITKDEIDQAFASIAPSLKDAIELAASNIERFHQQQLRREEVIETMPGIRCWRRAVPISRVGLYIPGGTAPLFSTVLMLAIPARIAGCREVILTTPPGRDGTIHPAIIVAAVLSGVTMIFKVGGVQAIGALAYGTATIPAVDKIFGPGNQYVNCAKQWVQFEGTAIDMPAGPSEVCIMSDESCNPSFVAADLLSQAEHGSDSQVLLVASSPEIVERVDRELQIQISKLARRPIAELALENSRAIVLSTRDDMIELVNEYAAEHLIIAMRDASEIAENVQNAGSVFIGNYSPESAGDYASGTNHVLPTNRASRSYSGASVDSFVKKITYQELTKEGLNKIGKAVELMALAEGLDAHKEAISIRLKD